MRVLPHLSLILAVAAAPAASLEAQQPPAGGSAVGFVYDSVRLRPLAGALVRVDTSDLFAAADADGRFRIDGIPPGQHYFRVEHPILDTLGVNVRSPAAVFAEGATVTTELGTPSAGTLMQLFCSSAWRNRGPAALVGRVREADTDTPATGAKVSLVWYELDITAGVRRAPRVRESVVGPDGIYRICGLPAGIEGRVQVVRGALTSGDIPIDFGDDLLALRSMSIAPPAAVVAAETESDSAATGGVPQPAFVGSARLGGRVVSRSGSPIVGARVQLDGTTRAAVTRAAGDFLLDSLPPGTQTVSVRMLGFQPTEAAVDLSSRVQRSVTLTMDDFVPTLETVRVTAQRERALDAIGYNRRKRSGQGWYLDGEEISNRGTLYFSDVLRSAPGVRISSQQGKQMIQSSRDPLGGCVSIWIDGTQWQQMEPGDVDGFVKPHEIAAIEVYSSSSTPTEFQHRGGNCTTIIAWTHRRLDRRR